MTWESSLQFANAATWAPIPLRERPIDTFVWEPASGPTDASAGRRLRAFALLASRNLSTYSAAGHRLEGTGDRRWTYGDLLAAIESGEIEAHALQAVPLRTINLTIDSPYPDSRPNDPDLSPALQDLGDEISEDVREALATLDSPSAYYPGV